MPDRTFAGSRCLNCGDRVESCATFLETLDGRLRVVERLGEHALPA